MTLLDNLKNNSNRTANRSGYSLIEIVGIMSLISKGASVARISDITGRSEHSLRYKFFEKTILKGQTKPRSIHKYSSMEELFQDHGDQYSEERLNELVDKFDTQFAINDGNSADNDDEV